ncbi:MAG: UDP-N-acetylmuramate--L-alanine ligase [Senegalimassilia sp.]|uniref:UDP-N-acetylmuramate--L-alanine ligase n=1 Tax=Senegalimassilia TaxID=1473205 RepID=UPI0023F2C6BD|nr:MULTISPECIES: UDP-N-acetylmuramate--L-alanine ligase [Senegalimassilia]MDR3885173.1 UDP-N-acetylmuramate--L-alanine ligase [Senegalimassilia sp.]MDR4054070.1 UDP-N-acetylmuramate--L-alanine ligase [Senegalimassilia sp.]
MSEERIKQVHFIGVGGVGMSGIARVAHDQGMQVSGSDIKESRYTKQLREAGITVFIGQKAENIPEGDPVVVISTAILENNPELIEARRRGLEIWHRAQMLAHLGVGLDTLAVAGTHGKTTTSSMLASALDALGADPTFLIGGIVRAYGTNAHSGTGDHYVVEADESDKSFTYLSPKAVLVTNIEADHLDHYKDLDEIYDKFHDFMGLVPEDGVIVACGEEPHVVEIARSEGRRMYTYGFNEGCDVRITSYEPHGVGSRYTAVMPDGTQVEGTIKQNPGRHNVLNATGVITLLWALGFDAAKVAQALSGFAGVRRRFDLVGEVGGVTVVDDYAHHPTEIAATISAAAGLGYKHVHVLFQPHRYSRAPLFTQVLHDEFGAAFDKADSVTFMDVYPAGEAPVPGVSGKTFLNVVLEHEGHPQADFVAHRVDVVPHLMDKLQPGDLVITMGAGDVTAMGPQIIDALLKARG